MGPNGAHVGTAYQDPTQRSEGSTLRDVALFAKREFYPGTGSNIGPFALGERPLQGDHGVALRLVRQGQLRLRHGVLKLEVVVGPVGHTQLWKDIQDTVYQKQLVTDNDFYAIMRAEELKVRLHGVSHPSTGALQAEELLRPPTKAARWFSYLSVGRCGKYNNYCLGCLYEQKLTRTLSRHKGEKAVSYYFSELTLTTTAESDVGVHIYKVAEHLKLLSYYQDMEDNEMPTHGWILGALITSKHYSVCCTWWDRMMVDNQALKGFSDHYWDERDDMQRRNHFKDSQVNC